MKQTSTTSQNRRQAVGKRRETYVKRTSRLSNGLLTMLAVAFTFMPILTIGLWVNQFFEDRRPTAALHRLAVENSDIELFRRPLISITFDDGRQTTYAASTSLLKQYDLPATYYVRGDKLADHEYLSATQIHSLSGAGHSVGI